jgi:predicted regulator of Ras-like GTPase activity (Roadblock/LC7/MglB family)
LFEAIFGEIHQRNPETYLIGIWGRDGLELEKSTYLPSGIDMDLLGAELADVLSKLDHLEVAGADICIEYISGQFKIFLYSLNAGYFLLLVSNKNQITGKLKFFLNLKKDQILSLL